MNIIPFTISFVTSAAVTMAVLLMTGCSVTYEQSVDGAVKANWVIIPVEDDFTK